MITLNGVLIFPCRYFVLSFMLSFLGWCHLCSHLMLSFFTVSKCYHFYVIIFPWSLSLSLVSCLLVCVSDCVPLPIATQEARLATGQYSCLFTQMLSLRFWLFSLSLGLKDCLVRWIWLLRTCTVSSRPKGYGSFQNFYVLQLFYNAKSVFIGA